MLSEFNLGISGIKEMVHISSDRMSATFKIPLPQNGKDMTVEEIVDVLKAARVTAGIDKECIAKALEECKYEEDIIVAWGKEPINGRDGYFTFDKEPAEKQEKPQVNEDGSVEYIRTEEYLIVNKGDEIATYTPATLGEFGYMIDSQILIPKKGKDIQAYRGKGFTIIDGDGVKKYIASTSGKLDIGEKTLVVSPILDIKEDVDISTGHIDFMGDVIVRGDVTSGMKVRSSESVVVYGHVGASHIVADKNITIKQGMQGKGKGKLEAGGYIQGTFFERAILKAKDGINANTLMDCDVDSIGIVKVNGRQGLILGGKVNAIQGIEAKTVGNEAEILSILNAGISTDVNIKLAETIKLMEKVQSEIDLLDRSTKIFEHMEKTQVTKEIEARRMKIIRAKVIKDTELKNHIKDYEYYNWLIELSKDTKVIVNGIVYRGTRVEIMNQRYNVGEIARDVSFKLRGVEVIMEGNR